jgi:hypothetical protein
MIPGLRFFHNFSFCKKDNNENLFYMGNVATIDGIRQLVCEPGIIDEVSMPKQIFNKQACGLRVRSSSLLQLTDRITDSATVAG